MATISEGARTPVRSPTANPDTIAKDNPMNRFPVLKQTSSSTASGTSIQSPWGEDMADIWEISPMVPPRPPKIR